MDNKKINTLARIAGCPVDKFAGIYLHAHVGDKIKEKEPIITLYSENKHRLNAALKYYKKEKPITFE